MVCLSQSLNRSRCRLGYGLRWAHRTIWWFRSPGAKGQHLGERTCQLTCDPSQRQIRSSVTGAVVPLLPTGYTRGDGGWQNDSATRARWQCGLLSDYFDHLFHYCSTNSLKFCTFILYHKTWIDSKSISKPICFDLFLTAPRIYLQSNCLIEKMSCPVAGS